MIAVAYPKRVLFVAYAFPPVGGVGVQRVTKFVKYLPEFGWQSSVLTVSNPSVPVYDTSMSADVPEETIICRARTMEPGYGFKGAVSASESHGGSRKGIFRRAFSAAARNVGNLLLQPDPQILWYPNAVRDGLRLLRETPHDAIVATAPPFSSLLVGAALARRTGLPLVLDYRDEWGISNSYWENKREWAISRVVQGRMQKSAVRAASALLATSRGSAEAIGQLANEMEHRIPVSHIYNGYDPDDFAGVPVPRERDRFRMVYVGTLWNLNSAEPLVKAVCELARQSPELVGKLELVFAGRRTDAQEKLLDQLNDLPCRVVRLPHVEHTEAISLMRTADALCLLCSDLPEAGRVINAKAFEYMAARRPILAIFRQGETWELVSENSSAICHEPGDTAGATATLATFIRQFLHGDAPQTEERDVSRFDRRQLAGELADLLDNLTNEAEPPVVTAMECANSF